MGGGGVGGGGVGGGGAKGGVEGGGVGDPAQMSSNNCCILHVSPVCDDTTDTGETVNT